MSFRQFVRIAVAVAISVWSGGALSGAAWAGLNASQWAVGAKIAFAAAAGAIQSGTVEGAAWGAFSAGVFFGIGQAIQGADSLWNVVDDVRTGLNATGMAVKTISHGLAGGTISHLQGSKFGHGFVSAAGSAATAPLVDASSANVVRGAVVTTLVGGTLSRISGGNFANGALTAAMSYAFASALSKGNQSPLGQKQVGDEPDNVSDVVRVNRAFRDNINVSCSEQHCDVSMRFTIGGDRTVTDWLVSWAADDIRRTWEGGYVYGERTYHVSVSMAIVSRSPDILISALHPLGKHFIPGQARVGVGNVLQLGAHYPTVAGHELGHLMGLSHQWNYTSSIMSYSRIAHTTGADVARLACAYGRR